MAPTNSKDLGKQIALLRKAQGLSQAGLAAVSGIPITAIRRCEQNGRIPLDRYLALASALQASLAVVPPKMTLPPPYKTIEDVIRSAKPRSVKTPLIRKPRLGGMFDQMHQTHRA